MRFFGHELGNEFYLQMTTFSSRNDGAQKTDPEHHVTEKNISPLDTGMEKISQDNLAERHDDHHAKKADNQPSGRDVKRAVDKFRILICRLSPGSPQEIFQHGSASPPRTTARPTLDVSFLPQHRMF